MSIMFLKQKQVLINTLSIGYYDGQLWKVSGKGGSSARLIEAEKDFTPTLLIISRDFYSESVESFPVVNKKELNRLLVLNATNDEQIHLVNAALNNQSWVNTWKVKGELPTAKFVVPESLLLSYAIGDEADGVVKDQAGQNRLFVTRNEKGVFSTRKNNIINSLALFNQSIGMSQKSSQCTLEHGDFADSLMAGLLKTPIHQLRPFIAFKATRFDFASLLRFTLIPIAMGSIYLLLTSGMLFYKQWETSNALGNVSSELGSALAKQDEVLSLQTENQTYHLAAREFKSVAEIWVLILSVYEKASLKQISYSNGRFVLRGEAAQATALLLDISNIEGVSDAKFDLPVSKRSGKDNFTISFELQNLTKGGLE